MTQLSQQEVATESSRDMQGLHASPPYNEDGLHQNPRVSVSSKISLLSLMLLLLSVFS